MYTIRNQSRERQGKGSAGGSYVGDGEARPTTSGPPGMVVSLLSLCTSPCIAPVGARSATRTRWQTSGATRPPVYSSYGSEENQPTVVNAGSPVLSPASGATLHTLSVSEVRRRPGK